MTDLISHSTQETEAAGYAYAQELLDANVRRGFIALCGEMGVGKTAFTRGFAKALGLHGVKSPTYTIVNEHRGGKLPLFHFDLYRIGDEDELYAIGFDDYLAQDGFCLSEWTERIPSLFSLPHIRRVTITRMPNDNERHIAFS